MRTKISAFIITASLLLTLFTGCSEINLSGNTEIKYKSDGDYAIVRELPDGSSVTEVIIADEYEGLPVTEVADFAGCNLENLEKITIGKNVETIGGWAFANNQKLKEFIVDEANENFTTKDGALYTKDMTVLLCYPCAGNISCEIPDTVKTIRTKAFYKCQNLESISLPSALESIEEKAFFRCSALKEITLPDTVKEIAKDAFGYCTALTEITLPAGLETIGDYAFFNCTSLIRVDMTKAQNITAFGKNWEPTNNGLKLDGLEIIGNDKYN